MTKYSQRFPLLFLFAFTTCTNEHISIPQGPTAKQQSEKKQSSRQVLDEFFAADKKATCFKWSPSEVEAFSLALQDPKNRNPNEKDQTTQVSQLKSVLDAYCKIDAPNTKPNISGSISLKNAFQIWNTRQKMKSRLLTSLQARAQAYQKLAAMVNIGEQKKNDALVTMTRADYDSITLLLAKLAEANRFVRVFPGIIKLLKQKNSSKEAFVFNHASFLQWFKKKLHADPNTGLLNFSEDLIWYESDPARYVGLKDLLNTSPELKATLAHLVHHASNNFVLRGRAANEYSLRNVVKSMLQKSPLQKLNDKGTQQLIALLKTHLEQDTSSTYSINLTKIRQKLGEI